MGVGNKGVRINRNYLVQVSEPFVASLYSYVLMFLWTPDGKVQTNGCVCMTGRAPEFVDFQKVDGKSASVTAPLRHHHISIFPSMLSVSMVVSGSIFFLRLNQAVRRT